MTKTMKRFLKIIKGIDSGIYDDAILDDFAQSLNSTQARHFLHEVLSSSNNLKVLGNFYEAFLALVRKDVKEDLLRDEMRLLAGAGVCSLSLDHNGNINGILIDADQAKKIREYREAMKGDEA